MRTPVTLRIIVPDDADAGDGVQVYTDFGSGTIDTSRPLLAKPAPIFGADTGRFKRFADFSMSRTFPTQRPGTLRETLGDLAFTKGLVEFARYVDVTVQVPPNYGMHLFAGQLVDAAGNEQGGLLPEIAVFVSSSEPPTVRRFAFAGYDAGTDRVTFEVAANSE